jgi:hypothetical protein
LRQALILRPGHPTVELLLKRMGGGPVDSIGESGG